MAASDTCLQLRVPCRMATYPYEDRFPVNRTLPEKGRPRAEILAELGVMAHEEDAFWETGRCSGTMYCGERTLIST